MTQAITRKFLAKIIPDVSSMEKTTYERYYLFVNKTTVIRVQSINGVYELERKMNKSDLVREGQVIHITKEEFDGLRISAKFKIIRDSYTVSPHPKIVLRVYHGSFEGLNRIEVNFTSENEALRFTPGEWFGREITGTPLAQDGYLLQLTKKEFRALLKNNYTSAE